MLNFSVVTLAVNLPGPVAAARLRQFGAAVTKIEPPGGDPLAIACPAWYAQLHQGVTILTLDLKNQADQARLEGLLAAADLLLTSMRPAALARLGLEADALAARQPHLCQVAIVGYDPPDEDKAGHDLTYQASLGLVQPPQLPRTLLADLAGAERAVSAALALLLARAQGQGAGRAEVVLATAAEAFAQPWQFGLTQATGVLGGGLPGYNLYETADGWVALAALEPHFWQRFVTAAGLAHPDKTGVAAFFRQQRTAYWIAWAREQDIPLEEVGEKGEVRREK